jgi:hypothetical protein
MSESTEILDTDYDTDSMDATSDSSAYRSVDSVRKFSPANCGTHLGKYIAN